MSFSASFFAPDLAPAADGSHAQQDQGNNANNIAQLTAAAEIPNGTSTERTHAPHSDAVDHEMTGDGSAMEKSSNTPDPASKTTAAKKKKGTAAAVKGPAKRARPGASGPGGPKKAKGGALTKAKSDGAAQPGAVDADADEGGNSSESDNGPYCLCRGPDDHRFMIACDRCEDWFHGECIGMDKHTGENLVQKYICPNCTDGGRYTTRYKKMCSLAGCANPARIYDAARPSIFCSPEHCQAWWEQLIGTLPKTKRAADVDRLTQEEFMGLLDAPAASPSPGDTKEMPTATWQLGKPPFETPTNFWDLPISSTALTAEEHALLTTSAAARYQLGEEIVLCKKMLQLLDMALAQRDAAVAAGKGTAKDLCGYDTRLDAVGATHQFARFLQTPQGEAIFKSGRLDTTAIPPSSDTTNPTTNPPDQPPSQPPTAPLPSPPVETATDAPFSAMCARRKCKPHNGWSALLAKGVRHDMKELAAQAKALLDAECRVRDGAAGRFRRRLGERNAVVLLDADPSSGRA